MVIDLIDKKIRQAFSNAAVQYDVLTGLHKEIGRDLIKKIKHIDDCRYVLDIGMGTGWLTDRLAFTFPEANVIGVDFAPGMIDYAKKQNGGFQIIQADACALPFKKGVFDLIVSNLAYQWVEDVSLAFEKCYTSLKEKGVFSFNLFGHYTLDELFLSLERSLDNKNRDQRLTIRRLPSHAQVVDAVHKAGFQEIVSDYERIKVRFPDMMALIKWIKEIGANTLEKEIFTGKDLLNRANDYYNRHLKDRLGIYATFEVIWVEAKKGPGPFLNYMK
jgi:malonyl-CoA O-methyltransferase